LDAAHGLLGARLVHDGRHGRRVGRIVEVEAYIGTDDRASHARFGLTRRNAVMFGEPGRAYLYLVYGMHTCLNVVTEPTGQPAAVLIRAVELEEGVELARADRVERRLASMGGTRRHSVGRAAVEARLAGTPAARLASGPGLVGAAFGLTRELTGTDLCDPDSPLRLEAHRSDEPAPVVEVGPRIGIAYAGEPWIGRPWRVHDAASPSVSGRRGFR
jgi:DNA-3-methyladenine glycosylase